MKRIRSNIQRTDNDRDRNERTNWHESSHRKNEKSSTTANGTASSGKKQLQLTRRCERINRANSMRCESWDVNSMYLSNLYLFNLGATDTPISPVNKRVKQPENTFDVESISDALTEAIENYDVLGTEFDDTNMKLRQEIEQTRKDFHAKLNSQKQLLEECVRAIKSFKVPSEEKLVQVEDANDTSNDQEIDAEIEAARLAALESYDERQTEKASNQNTVEEKNTESQSQNNFVRSLERARLVRDNRNDNENLIDRNRNTVLIDNRFAPASSLRFPKLKEQVSKQTNWINYRRRFTSEIEAQDCEWILEDPMKPPSGLSENEIQAQMKVVNNFFIKNVHDELLHIIAKPKRPNEILNALDKYFDPRGDTAK